MADIFDELEVATPQGDIFDEVAVAAPASPGEMRRREGQREIAASLTPAVDAVTAARFSAVAGGGGFISPPNNTPEIQAETMKMYGREGIPLLASMAIPGVGIGGPLVRAALTGAAGGAVYGATRGAIDVAEGTATPGQAAMDTAIGTVGGAVAGPALVGAARAIGAAGSAVTGGVKKGIAQLYRPIELAPEQLQALRARELIQTETGQAIPLGIYDVLNSKAIVRQLAGTADVTPEAMSVVEQTVMHAAANAPRSGRTVEDISRMAFDVLDQQKQGLSAPIKTAVEDFSRKAIGAVNKAEAQIGGEARSIFGGRSFGQIGTDLKDAASQALDTAKARWNTAYSEARALPEYNTLTVDLSGVKNAADQAGLSFARNADGGISIMSAPAGARGAVGAGSDLAATANIEQTRNLISELSRTINSPSYLPNVDTRVKMQVLQAAKQSLDNAVSTSPTLQKALGDANKLYSQNIDRFQSSFSKGILSDLGVEGGASPEAIMRRLTGPDAESNLQQLADLLGSGATAGDDLSNKGLELVREAVLSKARTAGESAIGPVSVGKMFDVVDSLPQPVRDRLFPGFTRARDLVVREAALKTAGKTTRDAELLLNQVRVDPTDLKTAFEGDYRDLVGAAKKAVGVAEARSKLLSNLGLDDLSKRSAFDIKDWMTDPSNQGRLKNTIIQLQKKAPQLVDDAKGLLMDDLLEQSTSRGVFDPGKFLGLVQKSQLPTGPGAPGVPQGKYAEAIESVFGKTKADEIKSVAATLTDLRRPQDVASADKKGVLNYIVFGYTGGPIASTSPATVLSALGRIGAAKESIKYSIASKFLTDDALRKEAMKPIGEGTVKALDRAVRLTAASIADQFGKNSPEYDEITAIDRSIQPGATRYTPPSTTAPIQRPAPVEQPRPQPAPSIEVPMPNRNGRLVNKVMTREEAMKKLEETRAQMQRLRQQLND